MTCISLFLSIIERPLKKGLSVPMLLCELDIRMKHMFADFVGSADYIGINYFSSHEVTVSKVTTMEADLLNDVDALFSYNLDWKR